MLKIKGKNKLSHYLYDMGLRSAITASIFATAFVCSIMVPILCPLATLLFLSNYYRDKYNLIFVYPLDFESSLPNRRQLVTIPLLGIILFQTLMLSYLY